MQSLELMEQDTPIQHVELADVNGDGALDMVITSSYIDDANGGNYVGKVYVRLQNP